MDLNMCLHMKTKTVTGCSSATSHGSEFQFYFVQFNFLFLVETNFSMINVRKVLSIYPSLRIRFLIKCKIFQYLGIGPQKERVSYGPSYGLVLQ